MNVVGYKWVDGWMDGWIEVIPKYTPKITWSCLGDSRNMVVINTNGSGSKICLCMYVYVCVCVNGIDRCIDAWMCELRYRVHGMYVCMHVWQCMYACMYGNVC